MAKKVLLKQIVDALEGVQGTLEDIQGVLEEIRDNTAPEEEPET